MPKKLKWLFGDLDINLNEIDAILVTHEHTDHTKGIGNISKKYNIPVYANEKTWNAMSAISEKILIENKMFFTTGNSFKINDLEILPFSTPHDAADPCGFNIINNGKKISVATDLGNINSSVFNFLKDSNCILLESNYDPNVLQCSHYPYYLKQRICSSNGHLSNSLAGKTISKLIDSGLEKALLIHLSKENNFPELAKQTVLNEIKTVENFPIYVAPRDKPSQLFVV